MGMTRQSWLRREVDAVGFAGDFGRSAGRYRERRLRSTSPAQRPHRTFWIVADLISARGRWA